MVGYITRIGDDHLIELWTGNDDRNENKEQEIKYVGINAVCCDGNYFA